jgi:NADH:ubiquinone reductase (H+-translocating)
LSVSQNASGHRVIIVGGGFGGLHAARSLRRAKVDVTLVDRSNHHLFQPLLYQVATGGLSPANIASPLRSILRHQKNLRVIQAEVRDFDLQRHVAQLEAGDLSYDSLIVAAGATHSYFGHDEWADVAPGLKTIDNATEIRGRILSAFEQAEKTDDDTLRERLMTFVIVGGGPTGVEMAGALSELSRHTMANDFRRIDPRSARIILVDASSRVLSPYPEKLSHKAEEFLHRLGVTVRTGELVTQITPTHVLLGEGDQQVRIETATVLWAAGVAASPLANKLATAAGIQIDRAGRVPIKSDLTLAGFKNAFVIGDMASCLGTDGKPLPGVAPVAIQQGKYVAKTICDRLRGRDTKPFHYRDYGTMATIGRKAAVVDMGRFKFAGYFAWLIWLFIHLMQLVGFENRLLVFWQWAWSYLTRGRSARLITGTTQQPGELKDADQVK